MTRRLRILHTVESYHPSVGGSQEVVRQVSRRLARRGHHVTVATSHAHRPHLVDEDGVHIAQFDVRGSFAHGIRGEAERYAAFLRESRFDVVMNYAAQQWATDLMLPLVGSLSSKTVLATCGFSGLHERAWASYFTALPEQLRRYDALVFHSSTYRDAAFCASHGIPGEVIPNAADESEFSTPRRGNFRRRHGLGDVPLVLTVCNHTGLKGHALVLDAFLRARTGNAVLAILGHGALDDGCLLECHIRSAITRVASLGRKRVLLRALPRAEVLDAFFDADLFAFGSRVECSPLVLFESAAAGLPFITVPAGNAAEIAAWTGAGHVLQATTRPDGLVDGDVGGMARAIERLLHDHALRARMGAAGRAAWQERFTWDAVTSRYEALYQRLCA